MGRSGKQPGHRRKRRVGPAYHRAGSEAAKLALLYRRYLSRSAGITAPAVSPGDSYSLEQPWPFPAVPTITTTTTPWPAPAR